MKENHVVCGESIVTSLSDSSNHKKYFEKILKIAEGSKGYSDEPLLRKAYQLASLLCTEVEKETGISRLQQALGMTETLAQLWCGSSTLAAALLFIGVKDCNFSYEKIREKISPEVSTILIQAMKIQQRNSSDTQRQTDCGSSATIDQSDNSDSPNAIAGLMVCLSYAEQRLANIGALSIGEQRLLIQFTECILLPQSREYNMQYFSTVLYDYCIKNKDSIESIVGIDGSIQYQLARDIRNKILFESGSEISALDKSIRDSIKCQTEFDYAFFDPLTQRFPTGILRPGEVRTPKKGRRILFPSEILSQVDGLEDICRKNVVFNEIVLTCKVTEKSEMLSRFIGFYDKYLKKQHLILEFKYWKDDPSAEELYVHVVDQWDNRFRIVIIPESSLFFHYIGSAENENWPSFHPRKSGEKSSSERITVYARGPEFKDGQRKKIKAFYQKLPRNATVLDFAFLVKPALALTVKAAYIQKYANDYMTISTTGHPYPVDTLLQDNDVVRFDCDYNSETGFYVNHAEFGWFRYLNTEYAKECLIQYFEEKEKQ